MSELQRIDAARMLLAETRTNLVSQYPLDFESGRRYRKDGVGELTADALLLRTMTDPAVLDAIDGVFTRTQNDIILQRRPTGVANVLTLADAILASRPELTSDRRSETPERAKDVSEAEGVRKAMSEMAAIMPSFEESAESFGQALQSVNQKRLGDPS